MTVTPSVHHDVMMMADDDWLAWRRQGLGASDLARADSGHYGGGFAVVADKLGLLASDIDPDDADRGHRWETAIADGVHALTGLWVQSEQTLVTSPVDPVWRATIDGLLSTGPTSTFDDTIGPVEIKTLHPRADSKWDYYVPQVQWQMLVCGKQQAMVALARIGYTPTGDETVKSLTLQWVDRDDDHIARLIDLAADMWALVQAGRLPDPDSSTLLDDVRRVHAADVQPGRVVIDDLEPLARELYYLKSDIKELHGLAAEVETRLRHRVAGATEAVDPTGKWRVRIGEPVHHFTRQSEAAALQAHPEYGVTRLDVHRFRLERPDAYDALKEPSSDRRLTIKETTE